MVGVGRIGGLYGDLGIGEAPNGGVQDDGGLGRVNLVRDQLKVLRVWADYREDIRPGVRPFNVLRYGGKRWGASGELVYWLTAYYGASDDGGIGIFQDQLPEIIQVWLQTGCLQKGTDPNYSFLEKFYEVTELPPYFQEAEEMDLWSEKKPWSSHVVDRSSLKKHVINETTIASQKLLKLCLWTLPYSVTK